MVHDAALPPGLRPSAVASVEAHGVYYTAARWTPDDLERLGAYLAARGGPALNELPGERLLAAWSETVEAFRDPASAERQPLNDVLPRFCRLSPDGLEAGLEAVLGGVGPEPAAELFRRAGPAAPAKPVLVILASNLPALALQPLLPALALRRPVVLKSPSSEPLFAPAFVAALGRREPALRHAVAAITWPGGDVRLEAPLLAAAGRILAYGEQQALDDLEARAPGKLVGYGPKTSLAVIAGDPAPEVAFGLARDVALFDQRGCLSVQAVYTDGDAPTLARDLAAALQDLAERWPPGPLDPAVAASLQQVRSEARLRGLFQPDLPLAAGTVIVDRDPSFRPGPGGRLIHIHPLPRLDALPELLAPWAGQLQGTALAGDAAWTLQPALEALGVSRFAAPGDLQSPDALWHNGGIPPLEALGG